MIRVEFVHIIFATPETYLKIHLFFSKMWDFQEHLILARQVGVEHIIVFVNKADLVDEDVLDLVELEARELLTIHGFDGLIFGKKKLILYRAYCCWNFHFSISIYLQQTRNSNRIFFCWTRNDEKLAFLELQNFNFPGENSPVIRGSALHALEGQESKCVDELMTALDAIPEPKREENEAVIMPIASRTPITGRGFFHIF